MPNRCTQQLVVRLPDKGKPDGGALEYPTGDPTFEGVEAILVHRVQSPTLVGAFLQASVKKLFCRCYRFRHPPFVTPSVRNCPLRRIVL